MYGRPGAWVGDLFLTPFRNAALCPCQHHLFGPNSIHEELRETARPTGINGIDKARRWCKVIPFERTIAIILLALVSRRSHGILHSSTIPFLVQFVSWRMTKYTVFPSSPAGSLLRPGWGLMGLRVRRSWNHSLPFEW